MLSPQKMRSKRFTKWVAIIITLGMILTFIAPAFLR